MNAPIMESNISKGDRVIMGQFMKSMQKIEESLVTLNAERESKVAQNKQQAETKKNEKKILWEQILETCSSLFQL